MALVKLGELKVMQSLHNREYPNVKARATRSQAVEGIGSTEGSTTTRMSPNNNFSHERPASIRMKI